MKKRTRVIVSVVLIVVGSTLVFFTHAFLKARVLSQTHACSGNLRLLDSMKEQWSMASGVTNGPVDQERILDYVKGHRIPICPGGGTYVVGNVEELPRCSIHGSVTNRCYPYWWRRKTIEPEN